MTFSEAVMWDDSYIKAMLRYRDMHLIDFEKFGVSFELYQSI